MLSFIAFVSAIRDPITSSYLRELAVHTQNAQFDERINEIVENVIAHASANLTKYTTFVRFFPFIQKDRMPKVPDKLASKSEYIIISKLQEVLIDLKIKISSPTYCNDYEKDWHPSQLTCKELVIEW